MENILEERAKEKGTYPIKLSFFDDSDPRQPVTPNTMTWTLTNENGVVVNSKQDIPISVLTTVVTVVLSGDDLQILTGDAEELRILTVEGDYDSSLGSGLALTDQVGFYIENLAGTQ